MSGLHERARQSGASKLIIQDLRAEFCTDYLFPMLHSGAIYERKYMLGTSIARPLIAMHQVEVAQAEGADAVAHGCTGKGNDQVRFELAFTALDPKLKVIAPWREWNIQSREDALDYLRARNLPLPQSNPSLFSRDRNLWHISHEGGPLEDANYVPEESLFQINVSPEKAPNQPEDVEIGFKAGHTGQPERHCAFAGQAGRNAQCPGREARDWPGRPGRKPPGGDEIPRRLRNPWRNDPQLRAQRTRIDHPRPRDPAL